MNDKIILTKIMELSNLDVNRFKEFEQYYKINHILFLKKIISLEEPMNQNIFNDVYINNEKLFDICNKYNINRFQLRKICEKIINISLYLSLEKCEMVLEDPVYEHQEFNELVYNNVGLCFEPIRILLYKKYNLVERVKESEIYILPKESLRIEDKKTESLLLNTVKNDFNVINIVDKIFENEENVIIYDLNMIKKYLDKLDTYVHPKDYKKIFDYIKENMYLIGENEYIDRKTAILTREWSIIKSKKNIKSINSNGLNLLLLSSIKSHEKI